MRPPISSEKLTETLTLCECHRDGEGPHTQPTCWWLYDKTRGMNLAMRALTRDAAFVEVITYYQKRLVEVEKAYALLDERVQEFVKPFIEEGAQE